MMIRYIIFLGLWMIINSSCSIKVDTTSTKQANAVKEEQKSKPLNVILLIGDGMGLSQISTRYYYPDGPINFERFKHIGLINTSSASDVITDSAAGATAFASGVSTYNAAIGVNVDTISVPTILEELDERGYKTGVISTSAITHATPACFYAHTSSRHHYEEIASQLASSSVDFFAGAGRQYFTGREDNKDLLSELKTNGFELFDQDNLPALKQLDINRRYGFLNADKSMPKMQEGRGNYLPHATRLALEYMDKSTSGFFLMVEGSQIDWGGHANDTEYIIQETADFDKVIGIAMDYAESDGNTLVIVTADHETGGFALSGREEDGTGYADYNDIDPKFTTGGHTATLIPVFAYGPKSESFNGLYMNTGIYHRIKAACIP